MKKLLVFTLLVLSISANYALADSIKTKSSDYQIINKPVEYDINDAEVISQNGDIKFVKFDDKIGIYDTNTETYLIKPILDSAIQIKNGDNGYIIKTKDLVGYIDITTGANFLTNFDDISAINNYLKIKKNGKYGLIDKEGNLILPPVHQKISIIESQGEEFISCKTDGKQKMFYKTGKLIPDNDLYSITYDSSYTLANNLKPIFKNYKRDNTILYERAEYKDNMVYEIKELKIPEKVKVSELNKLEKNVKNHTIQINNKEYLIANNNHLVGLTTMSGKEIVPAIYEKIDFKKPCKHFSTEVIIAEKNHKHTIYDLKGNILAEENGNKINIYKYGKVYNYIQDNGNWQLSCNKKILGNLIIKDKDNYEFTKTAFHLRSLHKINELLLAVLS